MSENLKIVKDKRHRSSSSLHGHNYVEGPYAERNIRGTIPEVDDQFDVAATRCDDLKQQLDLVRELKSHKRKQKKRSTTKLNTTAEEVSVPVSRRHKQQNYDGYMAEPNRVISVQARPKRKSAANQGRFRKLSETMRSKNQTRSYVNPDTGTQHRMIEDVRDYDPTFTRDYIKMLHSLPQETSKHNIGRRDSVESHLRQAKPFNTLEHGEVPTPEPHVRSTSPQKESRSRRCRKNPKRPQMPSAESQYTQHNNQSQGDYTQHQWLQQAQREERTVVELFNMNRVRPQPRQQQPSEKANRRPFGGGGGAKIGQTPYVQKPERDAYAEEPKITGSQSKKQLVDPSSRTSTYVNNEPKITISKTVSRPYKRGRHRSRGYELPTVASRMKQRGMRYQYGYTNVTKIPFIVTKSTTPSHNIGVNIQQVLNGVKIQQPISNIPLTIAHHMGLKHSPSWKAIREVQSSVADSTFGTHSVNVIKLGRRLIRLPSYKYMSYRRVLNLYQEGDGMVPKYLRSQTRPSYFYQPMFSEAAKGDADMGADTKPITSRQQIKQTLEEFASLNREYQALSQKKGSDPEIAHRLEELTRELAARDNHIRQVLMVYNELGQSAGLQASASTIEGLDCVRSSYGMRTASEL